MTDDEQVLMDYMHTEATAVCQARQLQLQVGRKWSVREKPLDESGVVDYEWKLIAELTEYHEAQDEVRGRYFVLFMSWRHDNELPVFTIVHDGENIDLHGPAWERSTFTEITPSSLSGLHMGHPSPKDLRPGWLALHIQHMVDKFQPCDFRYS